MAILGQVQRYLLLIRRVKKGDYPSMITILEHIEKEFLSHGVDEKTGKGQHTISRDIDDIRSGFGIEINYDKCENGYYISYEDTVSSIDIEKILEPFDILNSLQADTGLQKVVYPEAYRPLGTRYLFALIKAAKNHKQVEFYYEKYHHEDGEMRIVEPYAVKQIRGRWYLLAVDSMSEDKSLRTFGLDRICGLQQKASKFKPLDIDVKAKYADSFGIMTYEHLPVEDIVLEFDAMDGKYLKSVLLHHSQQVLEDTQDRFVISVRLRVTHDFLMEIASRCFSLKVISPASLRSRMVELFEEAIKRNRLVVQ